MKLQEGFTLIELMIVLAIVTFLAAIGYPSYVAHVTKSKRAAVESFMLNVANKEEQIMLDMRGYGPVASIADFPNAPNAASPGLNMNVPTEVSQFYTVTVAASNPLNAPSAYTITATPIGTQLTNDTNCPSLTLDQSGAKSPASGCW